MPVDISLEEGNDNIQNSSEDELNRSLEENDDRPPFMRQTSFQRELADCIVRLDPLDDIKHIIDLGATLDDPITQGLTPLHYAVWQQYVDAAAFLIDEGCDIDKTDNIGYTPLHLASEHGHLEMVELLLKHNAKVNLRPPDIHPNYPAKAIDEPLRLALKNNHYEVAKVLLDNGALPNTQYFLGYEINLINPYQVESLTLLLSYGANPNAKDRYGFTPLMKACRMQKAVEAILLLISYGADVNAQADERNDKRTVLHYAVLSGNSCIVDLLIKQGAKVNLADDYGKPSALDLALLKGDVSVVQKLIEAGADVNAVSNIIGTPLHMVASDGIKNRLTFLKMLLEKGANPNKIVWNENEVPLRTPLCEYLASNEKLDYDVISLFIRHGAEVVMQSQSKSPQGLLFFLPNFSEYPKVAQLLLSTGQQFDLGLIRSSIKIQQENKELLLRTASIPSTLKHFSRLKIRKMAGCQHPNKFKELEIPQTLIKFLMYEIW